MPKETPPDILVKVLRDTANKAADAGLCLFTPFLSPAEQDEARLAAKNAGFPYRSFGGYEGAERQIAAYGDCGEADYPIQAIALTWPHQTAPAHRDLLGSLMGLGIKRGLLGDIVLDESRAIVFASSTMAEYIARQLCSAGRVHLQTALLPELPAVEPPKGLDVHCTVLSLRLDAILCGGFNLSRGRAEELILSGRVKLCHVPCLKPDKKVSVGDAISAHGLGRIVVAEIGNPTKKGRLPVMLTRYGKTSK